LAHLFLVTVVFEKSKLISIIQS